MKCFPSDSHWHFKQSLVESAFIVLRCLPLFEDNLEVSNEVLQHDSLVVLNPVGVEEEAFDGFKSLLIAAFVVVLIINTVIELS